MAVTPNTTEASVGQPLPIIIEFWPTPFNLSSNKLFVYLPNPEITGIYPDSFIATYVLFSHYNVLPVLKYAFLNFDIAPEI